MRPEPYTWTPHPEATLSVLALVGAYAVALRAYPAPRWRIACLAAGAWLLLATAVTPLDHLTYWLLTAHLLQNVVLAEWAPALVVLGIPPALAAVLGSFGVVRVLTRPYVALPIWLCTYFAWHVPLAYDAALEHQTLLHLEHGMYLTAGLMFWWCVFQDEPHRLRPGERAAYLFAAFLLGSPLGLLLALLPTAIYDYYSDGPGLWGISALTDQEIAGMTMAVEQAVVFFTAFTVFFFRFLRDEERREDLLLSRLAK